MYNVNWLNLKTQNSNLKSSRESVQSVYEFNKKNDANWLSLKRSKNLVKMLHTGTYINVCFWFPSIN